MYRTQETHTIQASNQQPQNIENFSTKLIVLITLNCSRTISNLPNSKRKKLLFKGSYVNIQLSYKIITREMRDATRGINYRELHRRRV